MRILSAAGLVCFMVSMGCGTATPDRAVGSEHTGAQAQAAKASLEGTWRFALARSDVAAPIKEECAAKAGGDTARAAACFDAIEREASQEQIRFTRAPGGGTTWRSFGTHGGVEELYLEAPIDISTSGAHSFDARVTGPTRGPLAEKRPMPVGTALKLELEDARTLALLDPTKGRLVYHRAE